MLGMLPGMLGNSTAIFIRRYDRLNICYDVCEVLVIRFN